MITADFKITREFEDGVRGLMRAARVSAQTVIRKETGELIKTLVRTSPAAKPEKIRQDISAKFNALKNPDREFDSSWKGSVYWYYFSSSEMIGVAREADRRSATVEELKPLLYKVTPTGRIRGRHGKQRVLIWKKITTKASTVAKLIQQKIRNRGRLRAGWLVAVRDGAVQLSGGQPPAWVMRNVNGGTRGRYLSNLHSTQNPSFTIANSAKGIGQKQVNTAVRNAIAIRAKAMKANALLFMRGKKKLGDYAKS